MGRSGGGGGGGGHGGGGGRGGGGGGRSGGRGGGGGGPRGAGYHDGGRRDGGRPPRRHRYYYGGYYGCRGCLSRILAIFGIGVGAAAGAAVGTAAVGAATNAANNNSNNSYDSYDSYDSNDYSYSSGDGPVRPTDDEGQSKKQSNPSTGVFATVVQIIVALLIGWFIAWIISNCTNDYGTITNAREALASSEVTETEYYTDEGEWIVSESRLLEGLEDFYEETGVQPYVYILANGEVTDEDEIAEMAEELYDELFTDEGHFLLVFCDDNNGGYYYGYYAGASALAVMDTAAVNVLADELEYYYANAYYDEEVFSYAFAETADIIMSETVTTDGLSGDTIQLIVQLIIAAVLFICLRVYLYRKQKKIEEQQRLDDILNTPLETFGDSDAEQRAKKYE